MPQSSMTSREGDSRLSDCILLSGLRSRFKGVSWGGWNLPAQRKLVFNRKGPLVERHSRPALASAGEIDLSSYDSVMQQIAFHWHCDVIAKGAHIHLPGLMSMSIAATPLLPDS